jgi:oleandomycin transport system ATP-binding protein
MKASTTALPAPTGLADAIVARGLSKRCGATTAVDGVDLTIKAGTVFGLLGPNGAGKTTIVSILTTLVVPDGGHASVLGYDVTSQAHQVRQLIGRAGQDASLDETLTGTENLVLMGRLTGASRQDARQRAAELIVQFRLADTAARAVKTYSGGMRRRLDLAASLVSRPRVLFLDEPTTGLDPRSRNEPRPAHLTRRPGTVTDLKRPEHRDLHPFIVAGPHKPRRPRPLCHF